MLGTSGAGEKEFKVNPEARDQRSWRRKDPQIRIRLKAKV
jgi:hypothetical protein